MLQIRDCLFPHHRKAPERAQIVIAASNGKPVGFCEAHLHACESCGEKDRFLHEWPKPWRGAFGGVYLLCSTCNLFQSKESVG